MGTWNFTYDAVDRLATAVQTAISPTVAASQQYAGKYGCWTYDSFGNRTLEAFSSAACNNNPTPQMWATYNPANNQITADTNRTANFSYDAGGNTQNDGVNYYWYDAEGRLCAVQNQVIGTVTQYVYDAEGARVGKGTLSTAPATGALCAPPMSSGFTLTTRWLVDLGGGQVTELSEQGPPTPQTEKWAHSNVFSAARLTATYDTNSLHFELADPLGTKRLQANTTGIVEEWYASLLFGDVLTPIPNPACTAANYCYAEDATEHHFTGKERDTESGNDYFMARYYSSAMGRFMSPDWSAKVTPVPYAKLDNPQSLNLYAYVGNNPMTRFDPDGHIDCSGKNAAGVGCQAIAKWNSDHGISPTAKKSDFPGVPVKLPNGKTVPDPHSPTGVMMGPSSSASDVAAAGKSTGNTVAVLNAAGMPVTAASVLAVSLGTNVGTGGKFDDQRMGPQSDVLTGGFQQLPQFRDVSNFNVGLFAQQAGMSLDSTLRTAGEFAKHFSSNASPNSPYGLDSRTAEFIRVGYQAGATAY